MTDRQARLQVTTSNYEWLQVTTSDYKWLRTSLRVTTSDYKILRVTTSHTTSNYEWPQVTAITFGIKTFILTEHRWLLLANGALYLVKLHVTFFIKKLNFIHQGFLPQF